MYETKLELLSQKLEELIALSDKLRRENADLRRDKANLQEKLADAQRELHGLRLKQADTSQVVRSRLSSVMDRLEELQIITD